MKNNTGYEEGYSTVIDLSEEYYLSVITMSSYLKEYDNGLVSISKEPQLLFISTALFSTELDYPVQQKEFEEQADFFRYVAEVQNLIKEDKEKIEVDTCANMEMLIKT